MVTIDLGRVALRLVDPILLLFLRLVLTTDRVLATLPAPHEKLCAGILCRHRPHLLTVFKCFLITVEVSRLLWAHLNFIDRNLLISLLAGTSRHPYFTLRGM